MADSIFTVPIEFVSHDGRTRVNAKLWTSTAFGSDASKSIEAPRGVIQIVHGMAEHIGRYDDFARCLARAGYLVCGHDHVGHGDTAPTAAHRGRMHPVCGGDALVADVQSLRLLVSQQVAAEVPYFMFGHSTGSHV